MKKALAWFNSMFENSWIANVVVKFFHSLDNSKLGYSAKKITALFVLFCIIKLHFYYCEYAFLNKDFSLLPTILGTDFASLLALYGINEYDKNRIPKRGADANGTNQDNTKT